MKKFTNKLIKINTFLDVNNDGVYYTGHASIIARVNGYNFLFDYVKESMPYGDRWRFFPPLVENVPMEKIDGIFVSHIHQDHFDHVFLSEISNKCPIYIIEGRSAFENELDRFGIKYIKIPANKKTEIAPEVYIYGVIHDRNGVDASCFIGNRNFSVYHGNDNYLSNESFTLIDEEFSCVDVACIPYADINWFTQLLDNLSGEEKADESERLCKFYFEYAIEQANIVNARQVVPFGANLIYRDNSRSPLNFECKTPLEFESYVRGTRGEEEALRFKAIFSGDVIIKNQGDLIYHSADLFDEQTYRDEMQKYLETLNQCVDNVSKDNYENIESDFLPKIDIKTPTTYDHFVCVRDEESKDGVMINTRTSEVKKLDIEFLSSNNYHFHVFNIHTSKVFLQWLNKKISIEGVIGTREFSILRHPNIYNKEVLFIATTQL